MAHVINLDKPSVKKNIGIFLFVETILMSIYDISLFVET